MSAEVPAAPGVRWPLGTLVRRQDMDADVHKMKLYSILGNCEPAPQDGDTYRYHLREVGDLVPNSNRWFNLPQTKLEVVHWPVGTRVRVQPQDYVGTILATIPEKETEYLVAIDTREPGRGPLVCRCIAGVISLLPPVVVAPQEETAPTADEIVIDMFRKAVAQQQVMAQPVEEYVAHIKEVADMLLANADQSEQALLGLRESIRQLVHRPKTATVTAEPTQPTRLTVQVRFPGVVVTAGKIAANQPLQAIQMAMRPGESADRAARRVRHLFQGTNIVVESVLIRMGDKNYAL